jgi:phosphate transport system ATP-binding protein
LQDNLLDLKFQISQFNAFYGAQAALRRIDLAIPAKQILGIIGPAGAGKTTFLRSLNRLNDLTADFHCDGKILLDQQDIYSSGYDPIALRRRVGMLFALPVALPMSLYENVVYGPRLQGISKRQELDELVETSLQSAFIWDEVKDRLKTSAMRLSGGQQQRLCLARVLALKPDVILLDEPSSGLDPISTSKIEDALTILKTDYTIVLVTNNTMQAARVADSTAFFLMGDLIEHDTTKKIFTNPGDRRTLEYITGRFG